MAAYLPLLYAIVGGALGDRPDVDDVVQDTVLRVLRDLRMLRSPDSFRPWLVTIASRQVSTHLRRRRELQRTVALTDVTDAREPDTEDVVLLHLELSRQRRQMVRAARWLDPDDRPLLRLWWLETAGWGTRKELAVGLSLSTAHAAVRVQRMRAQLALARSLVAALEARPRCTRLAATVTDWDGVPSPLWRKRIARHARSCPVCLRAADDLLPPERLLAGLALRPPPTTPTATPTGESGSTPTAGSGSTPTAGAAATPTGESGSTPTAGSGSTPAASPAATPAAGAGPPEPGDHARARRQRGAERTVRRQRGPERWAEPPWRGRAPADPAVAALAGRSHGADVRRMT
jgi:RNA polymerase sigma factor (sigma-70 family)